MGSTNYEVEKPVHTVKIDGFYMGVNVVTVGQYQRFCLATGRRMPVDPTYEGRHFNSNWSKADHPMVNVSWNDAKAYCGWASRSIGVMCDLPTEAEWEYAARGGLQEKVFPWGDSFDRFRLHCSNEKYGDAGGTAPVGSYPANGYGLRDMAGNVLQWCSDWYTGGYNPNDADNPTGAPTGQTHVLRGGCWGDSNPDRFRCAVRGYASPDTRVNNFGFRVVIRGIH
jgi:formylglycine-generating enzyme required for sulfatase activity